MKLTKGLIFLSMFFSVNAFADVVFEGAKTFEEATENDAKTRAYLVSRVHMAVAWLEGRPTKNAIQISEPTTIIIKKDKNSVHRFRVDPKQPKDELGRYRMIIELGRDSGPNFKSIEDGVDRAIIKYLNEEDGIVNSLDQDRKLVAALEELAKKPNSPGRHLSEKTVKVLKERKEPEPKGFDLSGAGAGF